MPDESLLPPQAKQDEPTSDASVIGDALIALIRREIDASGGWIRFSRFMELALYAPGLGYYSAGAPKIGRGPDDGSDFVTAPELTPLFARAWARSIADALAAGGDTILELGGGTGRLAADLLLALEALGQLPKRYLLLDVSADLRERQRATITRSAPHLLGRVAWVDALPDHLSGVVLGNEILDALPVELIVSDGQSWNVRGVEDGATGFFFADRPMPSGLAREVSALQLDIADFAPGYLTEIHGAAQGLVGSLLEMIDDQSVIYFVDYGFPGSEYYHPQRSMGTLMAHQRHVASFDVLAQVGLQDITAHVNFSAIAAAAQDAHGTVIGYANQAAFLIECGIADLLSGDPSDPRVWAPQASALNALMSEAEMGELFKVIAIGRQQRELRGFRGSGRLHTL
jgi:SAM-dependent MidA family methyltransferase